jgi:hypothetical protein
MISVIICSVDQKELARVKESISKTIGVAYEILTFDNNVLKKGICEIYNMGVRAAKYEIICLMHEDIEMVTHNWGQKLLSIFENNERLGLVGVAGGGYKSVVPSGWYNADLEMNGAFYCNLIQGFKYNARGEFLDYRNPRDEKLSRVAAIDGCWMCTRRSIAQQNPFDEALLNGFHAYDIDFSLAVGRSYEVAVTYEILLKHFSEGAFSKEWEAATLQVHKKWTSLLPVNTDGLDEKLLLRYERRAFKIYHQKQLEQGSSYGRLMQIIWNARKSRIFAGGKWYKLYADLWRVWKKQPD